ncbi:hypothetical protein PIB30_015417 [Stylosanthes scabra]|uniref:4-coumarate--CoA ligase n=1 Tax=Stylosanthes scabra TaxID=79078 RepID=A0ABU6T906_9FABA|nr:hypothetical protein [Stylosanthes scabra]
MAANVNCDMPHNRISTTLITYPHWYSPKNGIYRSKHPALDLPKDPFFDLVSFVFSHRHNGVSALVDSSTGSSISYPKLQPLVKSMAYGLHKMGVSQGDVVLLLLPNSIYYPIVFMAVLCLGAVVAPLNPLKNEEGLKLDCFSCFSNMISGEFGFYMRPVIQQEDTAAILYSSGTTGVSKGVVLTHKNLISMVELFVRFEASQYEYSCLNNVFLAVLPMFHVYGLSLFALGLLSLGSTVIVMRKFDIDEVINAIDKFKVTHFPVVPPMLTALTKRAKGVNGSNLQSLIQVSSGAAPLNESVIEDFVQTFPDVDFIQGYGMTESTAVGTRGFNTEKLHNYSSVGLLAPNMEARVVDWSSDAFLPPGSSGELWLRGPAIMKGYLNNEEATMSTIDKDGWLHTGDVVYFDEDGYLHISDRLKDIIKYKGFQIAPADLEAVLMLHPEVVDVAVTAAMDEAAGEIPVAFVVRKVGSMISAKQIMDYVAEQVAPYKKVRKVIFIERIPRSPTGKILRRQLRNYFTSKL